MTNQLIEETPTRHRRPAWRQRLVEAEGGLRAGIRADSTLFAFFFCAIGVVLTSLVLQVSRVEWAILVLGLGVALGAELLHQAIKQLDLSFDRQFHAAFCLATSAVVAVHVTTTIVAAIVLWPHFASIWAK